MVIKAFVCRFIFFEEVTNLSCCYFGAQKVVTFFIQKVLLSFIVLPVCVRNGVVNSINVIIKDIIKILADFYEVPSSKEAIK